MPESFHKDAFAQGYRLSSPRGDVQWADYYALRATALRKPWGQAVEAADTPAERASEHRIILDSQNHVVAAGRWLPSREETPGHAAQIRSMAVAASHQGQGLGRRLLQDLEARCRGRGFARIILHARESALGFYRAQGYQIHRPGETLFGQIPHQWMTKTIDLADFSPWGLRRRAAQVDDGDRVGQFIFRILRHYGMAPEHEGIDRDLRDLPGHYAGGFFDLLEDSQGALRATVGMLPLPDGHVELRRMYLAPERRRQGLGRALLGHALGWARQQAVETVELETAQVLREATALYRWAGFDTMQNGELEAQRCDLRLQLRL